MVDQKNDSLEQKGKELKEDAASLISESIVYKALKAKKESGEEFTDEEQKMYGEFLKADAMSQFLKMSPNARKVALGMMENDRSSYQRKKSPNLMLWICIIWILGVLILGYMNDWQ